MLVLTKRRVEISLLTQKPKCAFEICILSWLIRKISITTRFLDKISHIKFFSFRTKLSKFELLYRENWNIKVATIDVTDEYSGESSIPPSEPKGKKKGKKKKKADAVSYWIFVFHKLKKNTTYFFNSLSDDIVGPGIYKISFFLY